MNWLSQRIGVATKNALLLASRGAVWILVDRTHRIFTVPAPEKDHESVVLHEKELVGVYTNSATRQQIHDDLWFAVKDRIQGEMP